MVGRHKDDAEGHAAVGRYSDRRSAVNCSRGTADCFGHSHGLIDRKEWEG